MHNIFYGKNVIIKIHQRKNRIIGITFMLSIINLDPNVLG